MTPEAPPPATTAEQIPPEELARLRINTVVEDSVGKNVASIRSDVHTLQTAAESEAEAALYEQYLQAHQKVTAGHENVRVEDLPANVKGVNYHVGTKNTAIDKQGMTAEQLLADPDESRETLDHENSVEDGHAGQRDDVEVVVNKEGKVVNVDVQLEGNVEQRMTAKHGQRSDQPAEVYGEGEDFANEVGTNALNEYVRKDGDRARFQAKIFEKSTLTREQMEASLEQVGYQQSEVERVMKYVRGRYEQGPEADGKQRPAGLAA